MADKPFAAGFKTNTFQEIKSHSSVLYNERLAILFYRLDTDSIELHTSYEVGSLMRVRSTLLRIYNNIRMLIYNNPIMRATLNLETKDGGVYVTDVMFDSIEKMIQYCQSTEWSQKRIYIIAMEINKFDMVLKNVLQYFQYFVRAAFNQKPDIEIATERYKEIADKKTIEELRAIVGVNNKVDFDNLGSTRLDFKEEMDEANNNEDDEEEDNNYNQGSLSLIDDEDKEPDPDVKHRD